MKTFTKYSFLSFLAAGVFSLLLFNSCLDDLDQTPPKDKSKEDLLNPEGCMNLLSKIYTGFSLSGIKGPSGDDKYGENDLIASDGDQGSLVFLRGLITMQEFPTDEALWNWRDPGIVEVISMNWDFTTKYAYTFYQRCMLNIRYCKEFLDLYPEGSTIVPNIDQLRDEVRAIRALNYYYLLDIYGNPGIIWDDSPTDDPSWLPEQIGRKALFEKLVAELKSIEQNNKLPETPSLATYARMTKPVVWTLLAKLYLNAQVYSGTAIYGEAAAYCKKVMEAYPESGLESNYANLFCAENDKCLNEIIFTIPFHETNTISYGSTILLTFGAYGGAMNPNWFGCNGSWTCLKPKETLVNLFNESPDAGLGKYKNIVKKDKRYLFFDIKTYGAAPKGTDPAWPFDGQGNIVYDVKERRSLQSKMEDWDSGLLSYKFNNLGWNGARTTPTNNPNTDFPLFRLADVYLMYAECAVRNAEGTDKTEALRLVNLLRTRAYGDNSGNINSNQLTASFILDERARELYWEGHRRTDLIRYGLFTSGYAWPYKGGSQEGVADLDSKFNLYPISDKDLTSNPKLVQNPGYQTLGSK